MLYYKSTATNLFRENEPHVRLFISYLKSQNKQKHPWMIPIFFSIFFQLQAVLFLPDALKFHSGRKTSYFFKKWSDLEPRWGQNE